MKRFISFAYFIIYFPSIGDLKLDLVQSRKQQAYSLGSLLRKKYDKFLGPYNLRENHALTAGFPRTEMSLQLALAGLFPPAPEDSWNNKFHWKPYYRNSPDCFSLRINIKSMYFTFQRASIIMLCIQFLSYLDAYYKTLDEPEFIRELSRYRKFLELMENNTGSNCKKKQTLSHKMDVFCSAIARKFQHKAMDLPLPAWYTDSILATIEEVFKLALHGLSWTPQLKRLNGGTLVRLFIDNIKDNRNAVTSKKIYLYCAHDLTLHGFLKALIDNGKVHRLSKVGILEGESITHNCIANDVHNLKFRLQMLAWQPADGSCDELCPLKDYLEIVKNYTATDEDLE
ncbi:hypothetical protein TSAR_015000 [Trichomalopsis sarcophagae]|uniref:2-phosphoxylose phosphatase 1 n=1 Tax=Trichomalopsis sarcophagae TaxID=543379 RepID=A0A232FBK5_9HYME|nr:hypothetical protein TSAR_015000 [Trichomalopsis sarcophagae]